MEIFENICYNYINTVYSILKKRKGKVTNMKKLILIAAVTAVLCSFGGSLEMRTNAVETVSATEHIMQNEETGFPDLDALHTEVTEGDFVFSVYDEFAFLTDFKDTKATEAVIPDNINGVPVVGIDRQPFGYCRELKAITLPDTLQYFRWNDLSCTTVVRVGSDEVVVPSVSKIVVSETNPYYTVADGILYSKDMKTLIGCPPAMGMKELKISEETETIGDYAFVECIGLEKAVIPSHIKHINNSAFTACINLKSVEIPESITSISGDTFYYCSSLSEVTFMGTAEKIGYGAFAECTSLKNFTIPETVTFVGANAFQNAGCIENENGIHYVGGWVVGSDEDISDAVIRDGVIGVAEMSFFSREQLELLDVPASVKYMGDLLYTGLSGGKASKIHHRSSYIGEKTYSAAKTSTDVYIYDPECEIFDSAKTIPDKYKIVKESENIFEGSNEELTGDIVIHGFKNSTAQAYAEKYNRQFEPMEESFVRGDVNGDGLFSAADMVLLQKWLLNVPDVELANWKAADLLEDGQLDVYDLCQMRSELIQSGETKTTV